jgi:hypothetical protein
VPPAARRWPAGGRGLSHRDRDGHGQSQPGTEVAASSEPEHHDHRARDRAESSRRASDSPGRADLELSEGLASLTGFRSRVTVRRRSVVVTHAGESRSAMVTQAHWQACRTGRPRGLQVESVQYARESVNLKC